MGGTTVGPAGSSRIKLHQIRLRTEGAAMAGRDGGLYPAAEAMATRHVGQFLESTCRRRPRSSTCKIDPSRTLSVRRSRDNVDLCERRGPRPFSEALLHRYEVIVFWSRGA